VIAFLLVNDGNASACIVHYSQEKEEVVVNRLAMKIHIFDTF